MTPDSNNNRVVRRRTVHNIYAYKFKNERLSRHSNRFEAVVELVLSARVEEYAPIAPIVPGMFVCVMTLFVSFGALDLLPQWLHPTELSAR